MEEESLDEEPKSPVQEQEDEPMDEEADDFGMGFTGFVQ